IRPFVGALERHGTGDLERHLRGVDGVVRAVDEHDAYALDRRPRELAVLHRFAYALVDRGTEALRDHAADDLVDELVALVALERLEDDLAVAELAAAAGLLLVPPLRGRLLTDRLEVRHTWLMQFDVDAEAPLQPLDRDLDVHLRQTGQQLLPGLRVPAQMERRVLLGEASQPRRHLLLVALRLRRDGEAHHRLGEADSRQLDLALAFEQQVAGLRLLQLGDCTDVARAELVRRIVFLPLQLEQRADPLLRVCARVRARRVALHRAAEHAEDVDTAGERIGDRLEDERRSAAAVDVDRRALLRRRRHALDE